MEKVERILTVLDAAATPQALDLPGYALQQLKGDVKRFGSVTVSANWRVVELIDYHKKRI